MMRSVVAVFSLLLLSFPAAASDAVRIAPVTIGEPLMEKADEYGEREFEHLTETLERRLARALEPYLGDGGAVLEVTLVDAVPNRPTMRQMRDTPGLSQLSISLGYAELEATLIAADGTVLQTYSYSRRTPHIRDAQGTTTWHEARRAFSVFARNIANSIEDDLAGT